MEIGLLILVFLPERLPLLCCAASEYQSKVAQAFRQAVYCVVEPPGDISLPMELQAQALYFVVAIPVVIAEFRGVWTFVICHHGVIALYCRIACQLFLRLLHDETCLLTSIEWLNPSISSPFVAAHVSSLYVCRAECGAMHTTLGQNDHSVGTSLS